MLDSPAFLALSPHGTRLLVAFGRQFRGNNNASLILPFSMARKYGFSNQRTYYAALAELKRLGFIEMTRPAVRRGTPTAARYALTWIPIHEPVGDIRHDLASTDRPSNEWENWKPERWAEVPVKRQKAIGKTASYRGADLPVKNSKSEKTIGKTASHKPVFADLRQADLPVDLISTIGAGDRERGSDRLTRPPLAIVTGGVQ